jgi:uroporphyrinogen-III synthase
MMNNALLNNRIIMITRPTGQAENLCQLVTSAGGKPLHLPTIEIAPVADGITQATATSTLQQSELVIFISSNAVSYLLQLVPDAVDLLADKEIYAVGAATCRALVNATITHARFAAGTGSEALLDLKSLQQGQVSNKTITIVRGKGGREMLKEKLQSYGAGVYYLEVYQRQQPVFEPGVMKNIWHDTPPDAIVISSAEGLHNLIKMTDETDRTRLFQTPLVVISKRLRAIARSSGFRLAPQIAADASDDSLFTAVSGLFEEQQ